MGNTVESITGKPPSIIRIAIMGWLENWVCAYRLIYTDVEVALTEQESPALSKINEKSLDLYVYPDGTKKKPLA